MGPKETRRILKDASIGRSAIVALSARPPGVHDLCVCVCVCVVIIDRDKASLGTSTLDIEMNIHHASV